MKLAIVGGRDFQDYELMKQILEAYRNEVELVVSGGAKGTDALAERWAEENNIPTKVFYPDWKKYGRAAGPIRNKEIVSNAEFVIAFWNGTSRGTKNDVELAKKMKKELKIVTYVFNA